MEDGKHEKKSNQRMLSAALIAGTLAGCGSDNSDSTESTAVESTAGDSTESADSSDGETEGNSKYKDFITVDVFDSMANYQGIQSGWFAKIVKDKFNMELNIIAQNVAGGGDTLFQTRSAAGDLGDLIITGCGNGRLQNLVTAGLVIDMTDYLKDAENVHRYDSAIETTSQLVEEDGIWAIPSESSSNSPTTSSEGLEPNYGAYLRWDAYKAAGYPELNTLEDLLPALQKMQEAVPTSDSGKQTYAISLFKDWDGNLMSNAKPEASLYGYDEIGFVLAKADGSDYQSFIDSDSAYVRSLKFLFEANQMGLVDPESTTQNYDTLFAKYQDGQILFSPYPWLGQSAYNTDANKAEGKGFMLAPIADECIFSYGCQVNGNGGNAGIMIGSKAEDPQRLADFIDWLYSPEGIGNSAGHSVTLSGPEGLTWEMKDGAPVLTEFGKECLVDGDAQMPEEYGGGSWKDGKSQLGIKAISSAEINPETNHPYDYTLWDSYTELNSNELIEDWQKHYGVKTAVEYYKDHGQVLVAPGCSYSEPAEDSEIATIRTQINSTVVEYSWKAVFARDEAEFDEYIRQMQETVYGLGYERILEIDMQKVADQKEERQKVLQ